MVINAIILLFDQVLVKKLQKEINHLKNELAMHDTLVSWFKVYNNIDSYLYLRVSRADWLGFLTSSHLPFTAVGSNPARDYGFFCFRKISN